MIGHMARFSDRIGVTKSPSLVREGMPPELRTALWNLLHVHVFDAIRGEYDGRWLHIARSFYLFNHLPLNNLTAHWATERNTFLQWWFNRDRLWWELYNTIDHLAPLIAGTYEPDVYHSLNETLEAEGSPFRFIDRELTEITDENEMAAVSEALSRPPRFSGARAHLIAALRFLGQRPEPDYRNSISESISAVESTLKVVTGLKDADLSEALKEFAKTHPVHRALVKGLNSLYGYTSNEHGIRHALIEGDANVGFAEAKFMAVACAAFVNFLIAKSAV
jgi:hypothetical protein